MRYNRPMGPPHGIPAFGAMVFLLMREQVAKQSVIPIPSVIPALTVIPAKAGIYLSCTAERPYLPPSQIPAFAGMTACGGIA